jgi:site-specific DNA-cytosine methylase
MKVLVACEYSGTVRDAFIRRGHDAVSCDLLPTDAEGPHYQGNVFDLIDDRNSNGWDLMIGHPPCTHLAVSGSAHFAKKIADGRQKAALDFVSMLMDCGIGMIAIENPISVISSKIRKPDQIIHPWQFGHETTKATCLWLKNLPLLTSTKIVGKGGRKEWVCPKTGKPKSMSDWFYETSCLPQSQRSKARSKTFSGIAEAMAEQWGSLIP